MADKTKIEWTDATWNPITGCSVVSPGCTNCYAMRLAGTRLKHHPSRAGLTRDTKAGTVWTGEVRFNPQWLDQPLRWSKPRMIFVCAHGDLFAEGVEDAWLDQIFAVMALSPQHTFQVLTKRPERMRAYMRRLERIWREMGTEFSDIFGSIAATLTGSPCAAGAMEEVEFPLPNVWLGVSCEDQRRADERVPVLLDTPAAIRWVSAEPLLGPIDFSKWMWPVHGWWRPPHNSYAEAKAAGAECGLKRQALVSAHSIFLDWIVAGGESGPGARPMHPDWVRKIRDDCAAVGVPFLFKQWGAWLDADELFGRIDRSPNFIAREGVQWQPPRPLNYEDAAFMAELLRHPYEHQSDGTTMLRLDKHRSGRLLDGVEHNGFPEVR